MKNAACTIAVALVLVWTSAAGAREQDPQIEIGPARPAQEVGVTLGAATLNLVYVPLRLALTIATAELGGLTAWMTGGSMQSARAVWNSTDGQAFITPAMLEGREQLHFGMPARGWR